MPMQTVKGVTLSYTDAGRGPALVFVHGFPLDSRMWEDQIAYFSSRARVIAPDLRGFGKSPSIEPFSIASLADDIHALLARLNALPCLLCGLSMGGYVALSFARKHPADLRALVLVDTRAEADSTEAKTNRNKMIELVRSAGSKAISEQMLPKLLAEATRQKLSQVSEQVRQMTGSCLPLTIEHALEALRDREDQTQHLPSIAVPTLIVVGEQDVLTPPDLSRAMHAKIPRSELVIIPGCGHMTPMEQPEQFNQHLHRFVSGHIRL